MQERNFECYVCYKDFFTMRILTKHEQTHTGEKSFKCVICTKGFTRNEDLINYERMNVKSVIKVLL